MLLLLVPITTLPRALIRFPLLMVTAALAVIGAARVEVALTVKVCVALAPKTTLPFAVTVAEEEKVVGELMLTVLLVSVPSTILPYAANRFPVLTVTGALAVTAARKVVAAATVKVLELSVPMTALPRALKLFPAVMLTGAVAVTADAKRVAALTVSVCELVVPMAVLPVVLSVFNSALPDTVRVPVGLGMLMLLAKVANPLLSMVSRSTSWPLPVLVLPVELVLKMRLPPSLLAASCIPSMVD